MKAVWILLCPVKGTMFQKASQSHLVAEDSRTVGMGQGRCVWELWASSLLISHISFFCSVYWDLKSNLNHVISSQRLCYELMMEMAMWRENWILQISFIVVAIFVKYLVDLWTNYWLFLPINMNNKQVWLNILKQVLWIKMAKFKSQICKFYPHTFRQVASVSSCKIGMIIEVTSGGCLSRLKELLYIIYNILYIIYNVLKQHLAWSKLQVSVSPWIKWELWWRYSIKTILNIYLNLLSPQECKPPNSCKTTIGFISKPRSY